MTAVEKLSTYEIDRNKPMPNIIHGAIQSKINLLLSKYGDKYLFPNETKLATEPPSTPDICLFPKRKLNIKTVESKETIPPITTIEIQSPSQSPDELVKKAWDLYFPMGVKSAWIVIPALKAVQILLPNDKSFLYTKGILKDPATGIEIEIEKIFEDLE